MISFTNTLSISRKRILFILKKNYFSSQYKNYLKFYKTFFIFVFPFNSCNFKNDIFCLVLCSVNQLHLNFSNLFISIIYSGRKNSILSENFFIYLMFLSVDYVFTISAARNLYQILTNC